MKRIFLTFYGNNFWGRLGLSKFVKIDYSAIEQDEINVFDLVENPSQFIIFDIKDTSICDTCHSKLTWKKNKNCVTLLCGCGCRIWFKKRSDGVRITKFISKQKFNGVNHGRK